MNEVVRLVSGFSVFRPPASCAYDGGSATIDIPASRVKRQQKGDRNVLTREVCWRRTTPAAAGAPVPGRRMRSDPLRPTKPIRMLVGSRRAVTDVAGRGAKGRVGQADGCNRGAAQHAVETLTANLTATRHSRRIDRAFAPWLRRHRTAPSPRRAGCRFSWCTRRPSSVCENQ